MAWNKPTEAARPAPRKSPSALRGLVAGLVVVAVAAGAYFVFLSGDEDAPQENLAKKTGVIKAATPSAAPTNRVEKAEDKAPKPEKPKQAAWRDAKLTPEQRDAIYEKSLAETPLRAASTNRLFRSGLEQVMGWVFTTELGDLPPPLPNIPDFDYVHLQEILELKNTPDRNDSERSAETKQIVDYAKQELKKYVEKGGDPQDFLQYYHDELKSAYQERKMVEEQVMQVLREEPELADDYVKKVNESLAKKGIKGVIIPERIRRRIEAEQLEQMN